MKLVDAEGVETVVEAEAWSVLRDSQRPRLVGKFGRSLPRIPRSGRAEIRFNAGFGEAWDDVPADLRQAVFLLAAHFYENRAEGAAVGGVDAVRRAGADRGLPRDADRRGLA